MINHDQFSDPVASDDEWDDSLCDYDPDCYSLRDEYADPY
jgi:hypothetical protein